MLKNMFKKTLQKGYISLTPEIPKGLWKKCNFCKEAIFSEDVLEGDYICPKCGGYFRMHAYDRIDRVVDEGSFEEWDMGMLSRNPLKYVDYESKLEKVREKTRLDEAVVTGKALIGGISVVLGVCDSHFLMGSMGEVVGEKITRAIERASEMKCPLILFACSGGARMQEGIISLMQMAKTSAALKRHSDQGQLYISVLTDPTTGGVTASFAMLGDIILAEPGALIGFAGPRVIEQTIGQKLPKGFQRSEFLLEHGFIDAVVKRSDMKEKLLQILKMHPAGTLKERIVSMDFREKAKNLETPKENTGQKRTPWERVQVSRMMDRPVGSDYIKSLFSDFMELHGDRYYKDDPAIIGGIGYFMGIPVTVVAQAKGNSTKENVERNFGMPSPDGYRKALRLMKQAEKFGRPVICFVDTPGAFCGLEAEERGQGEAIARNLFELSGLRVPVLSIVIGEGGSGGALAMAVADQVWMFENSIYSILSPEGFASILWKDSKRASEAASVMKLTARNLEKLGIIEQIIEEPEHFTRENLPEICEALQIRIQAFLSEYGVKNEIELMDNRYARFRRM